MQIMHLLDIKLKYMNYFKQIRWEHLVWPLLHGDEMCGRSTNQTE